MATRYCTHHRCILSALSDAVRLGVDLEDTIEKMVQAGTVPCRLDPNPLTSDGYHMDES